MKRIFILVSVLFLALQSFASAAPEKEWTFLLFLNGNNNLDQFGTLNLNQMEQAGSSDAVNLVAQWASLRGGFTKRLLVQKDNDLVRVTSPAVQELGKVDMGDPQVLEDFIKWGMTNYPAKHYFVAVWNHGSGWRNLMKRDSDMHISDISYDDNTGNAISTKQLGEVMNNASKFLGRKIDIYGSDACLMGMLEIAAEMSNGVDYFIGSQELEPGEGWPYHKIFMPLVANPLMSARELSALLTEEYTKAYQPGGAYGENDATMSAVDLGKYSELKQAVDKLGAEIRKMEPATRSKVASASKSAQSFEYSDYVDLGDFLAKLTALNLRDFDATVIRNATNALKDYTVLNRVTENFPGATGVSIWIPKDTGTLNRNLAKYKALQFDGESHWSDALAAFVGK